MRVNDTSFGFCRILRLKNLAKMAASAVVGAISIAPTPASAVVFAETHVTINITALDLDPNDGISAAIIGDFRNTLRASANTYELNRLTGKPTESYESGGIPGVGISNGFSAAKSIIGYQASPGGFTLSMTLASETSAKERKSYPVYRLPEAYAYLTTFGISVTPNTGLRVAGSIDYSLSKSGAPEFEKSYAQGRIVINGDDGVGYMNDLTLPMTSASVSESKIEAFSFDITKNTLSHRLSIEASSSAAVLMSAVPEPATSLLLTVGIFGVWCLLQRRRTSGDIKAQKIGRPIER